MKRFYVPWLHFLVRPSRVDFASLAARYDFPRPLNDAQTEGGQTIGQGV